LVNPGSFYFKKIVEVMKEYIIVLDAGHGESDPGAVGPTGLKEKDVAWRIACMVADTLMRYDIEVIFTRVGLLAKTLSIFL